MSRIEIAKKINSFEKEFGQTSESLNARSLYHQYNENFDDAISYAKSALGLDTDNVNSLRVLGDAYLSKYSSKFEELEDTEPRLFTLNDEDFNYKLGLIDKNLTKEDFNFVYISKPQNSGGYTLEIEKIIKKNNKHLVYFKENKPPTGSANIMAITATYCFLKINNIDKVKVIIK